MRIVTLAAESPGAGGAIRAAREMEIVVALGTQSTFKLLEALAGAIGSKIQELYPLAAVAVEIEKLAPPCPGVPASCGVRLHLAARDPGSSND